MEKKLTYILIAFQIIIGICYLKTKNFGKAVYWFGASIVNYAAML